MVKKVMSMSEFPTNKIWNWKDFPENTSKQQFASIEQKESMLFIHEAHDGLNGYAQWNLRMNFPDT